MDIGTETKVTVGCGPVIFEGTDSLKSLLGGLGLLSRFNRCRLANMEPMPGIHKQDTSMENN